MSNTKSHQFRPPLYHRDERSKSKRSNASATARAQPEEDADKGWEAYRKWLSTVSTRSRAERAPVDRSIYSWKGYHTWADKVKQSWKPEDN